MKLKKYFLKEDLLEMFRELNNHKSTYHVLTNRYLEKLQKAVEKDQEIIILDDDPDHHH